MTHPSTLNLHPKAPSLNPRWINLVDDDKSKKKKHLDYPLSRLHSGKGNSIGDSFFSGGTDSLFRKATESADDLNKLQEMLGPLGGNPGDAKRRVTGSSATSVTAGFILSVWVFSRRNCCCCWRSRIGSA
jgi:hypothetical protein